MTNEVTILLAVSLVESGGNTGDGKYFYSFTPNLLHIEDGPSLLTYTFGPETPPNFEFLAAFACDPRNQLGMPRVSDDKRSVTIRHFNTLGQLALLSFLVKDTLQNCTLSCDPQVTNIPGHTS